MAIIESWVVVLCKWQGNDFIPGEGDSYRDQYIKTLFNYKGTDKNNLARFFLAMSRGAYDLSDAMVMGWWQLEVPSNAPDALDKAASEVTARLARGEIVVGETTGVILVLNGPTPRLEDFALTSAPYVWVTHDVVWGTVMAHEILHALGVHHTRRDDSPEACMDRWDVMSAMNCYWAADPDAGKIGPRTNAWILRRLGWLDESRVFRLFPDDCGEKAGVTIGSAQVELGPLTGGERSDFVAIEVGPYLVELRVPVGWDLGVPHPAVLVHRWGVSGEADCSFAVTIEGQSGRRDYLVEGDSLDVVAPSAIVVNVNIHVVAIHQAEQKAVVRVEAMRICAWERRAGPSRELPHGYFVSPSGRLEKIPPDDPMQPALEQILATLSAPVGTSAAAGTPLARRDMNLLYSGVRRLQK